MHVSIATNTAYQFFARLISASVSFATTIILARALGIVKFGELSQVTIFVGFFYLILDFGLNAVFLQREESDKYFGTLLYGRLLIAVLLAIIASTVAFLLPQDFGEGGFSKEIRLSVPLFSLTILSQAIIFTSLAYFQKKLRFDLHLVATAIGSFITLFLTFYFALQNVSVFQALFAFIIGSFVTAFLALSFVAKKLSFSGFDFSFFRKLFMESLPLGLMLVCNLVYFRSDIFILSIFKPVSDVGIYSLAYKFFDFLIAVPLFMSNSLYPLLVEKRNNATSFFAFVRQYLWIFLIVSFVCIIIFWFSAPLLAVISESFSESILPFRILLLSLPFFFLTSILQWILIAQKKQLFLLSVYLFSAFFNVFLNIIFVPQYSYIASALITGASECLILIVLAFRVFALFKLQKA